MCPPFSGREYRISNFIDWQKKNSCITAKVIHLHIELFSHPEDIEVLFESTHDPIIFIPGETLLEKENSSILSAVTFYKSIYKIPVLIFFESSLVDIRAACEKNNEKLLQNIEYLPLLDYKNTEHFARHLGQRWKLPLSSRDITVLYQFTGGQMWLIKEVMRQMHRHDLSIFEALTSEEVYYKSSKIWNKLSSNYKNALLQENRTQSTDQVFSELKQLNLIQSDLKVNSTAEFIADVSTKVSISITFVNDAVYFNDVNVTSFFSDQEFLLLQAFVTTQNNLITREQAASLYWPNAEYSDWALDKSISRFRKKLVGLGISKKSLVTLRDKGYHLLLHQ